jgi:transcriptional regulator GlxA family with amidase domain
VLSIGIMVFDDVDLLDVGGLRLLADQGLLDAAPWTTHWEDIELLAAELSTPPADAAPAWVDAGRIVTAGGLSSGIAMSLHLVDRLASRELAIRTARQLDYAWNPDAGVVTPRRPVITPT